MKPIKVTYNNIEIKALDLITSKKTLFTTGDYKDGTFSHYIEKGHLSKKLNKTRYAKKVYGKLMENKKPRLSTKYNTEEAWY